MQHKYYKDSDIEFKFKTERWRQRVQVQKRDKCFMFRKEIREDISTYEADGDGVLGSVVVSLDD